MPEDRFDYVLELTRDGGGFLGRFPIRMDWGPIQEALALKLVRQGTLRDFGEMPSIRVEPRWVNRAANPCIRGVCATAVDGAGPATAFFVSIDYFRQQAQRVADRFVESGELQTGELFEYRVLATERPQRDIKPPRFAMEPVALPAQITPGSLEEFMGEALLLGTGLEGDVPVFVPWRVLEEASVLTRQAGELETGGVLVGHVRRDLGTQEIFLEVTAQIPARARSQLTRLSFTPDTWSDLQAAVNLRGRRESWLGWWHSHSFSKRKASTNGQGESSATQSARPFLSEEDHTLHRTVFPRAYSLALLMTDSPRSGLCWTMFGWRAGTIARRDFHVIGAPMPESFTSLRGENHAASR